MRLNRVVQLKRPALHQKAHDLHDIYWFRKTGNNKYFERLYQRYIAIITSFASQIYLSPGHERSDNLQEISMAFYRAVKEKFKIVRGKNGRPSSFIGFIRFFLNRRTADLYKKITRQKEFYFNAMERFEDPDFQETASSRSVFYLTEEQVVIKLFRQELLENIEREFTDLELKVFIGRRIHQLSYDQILEVCQQEKFKSSSLLIKTVTKKSIDNALARANKKIEKIIERIA